MRRSSENSLLSYHSVDLTSNPGYPIEDEIDHSNSSTVSLNNIINNSSNHDPESLRPPDPARPRHRVRFGSDLRYEYGNSAEQESTDANPDERHSHPQSYHRHRRSLSDRVRSWMSRLRPPDDENGDLQPFHQTSSQPRLPLHLSSSSSTTPNSPINAPGQEEGNGGDEEKRQSERHHHPLDHPSAEAHRLVREVTNETTSHHWLTAHNQHNPIHHGSQNSHNQHSVMIEGAGILSQLLRLSNVSHHEPQPQLEEQNHHRRHPSPVHNTSPTSPAKNTTSQKNSSQSSQYNQNYRRKEKPKWYKKPNNSTSTLIGSATNGATTPISNEIMSAASKRLSNSHSGIRLEDEIQITLQIAEILSRQRYIIQLCRALMIFGAPTHRLEEYMKMTARALQIESQYLYVPGCMIIAFDDPSTRTTEVKLVRVAQGIDLGRLSETHSVYKNIIHDVIGVEEASAEIEHLLNRPPRFNKFIIVLVYGLATAMVGPFAFDARPIDLPIIFANGSLLGIMQHVLAPRSVLYSNVFEVTAAVLTSFLARALGSITIASSTNTPTYLFCFSAIAQSSIALILPGYLVLCSSLELQSHQIVAGSIRMVYAIIYSLFLGYGITVGTTIYGLIDPDAVSATTCPRNNGNSSLSGGGRIQNPYLQRFPFVAGFAACLLIVNQGKWKQAPIMVLIAVSGYVTNYFTTQRLGSGSQVANTVGAFTIGVIGNLYSRICRGHAATAILPGIFVLVPSGLAASGSLISGIESADEVRSNVSSSSSSSAATTTSTASTSSYSQNTETLGFGMVQVAISISVGLFVAALVVYPFGKRRSGLFSF